MSKRDYRLKREKGEYARNQPNHIQTYIAFEYLNKSEQIKEVYMKFDQIKTTMSVLSVALVVISLAMLFGLTPTAYAQGETPPPPEIVGGAPADPGEWPWQVALVHGDASGPNFWYDQFCGGSLISAQWVVTAAHCVTNGTAAVSPSSVDVVAGIYDLWEPASGYQQRNVASIVVHPSWNPSTMDYDIALLKLASPVTLGGSGETKTAAVPLVPSGIGALTGTTSWVTGWGYTYSTPEFPDELYEVSVPIIANSVCNDASHYNGAITDRMLCAGYDAGGHDSCWGDSGGPLVVWNSGQWQLAGIVSWGDDCAQPYKQGVYTRVSEFVDWITNTTTPPSAVTLSSPTGSIGANSKPTYTWSKDLYATWYYLWVNGPDGSAKIKQWFEASAVCGASDCTATPNVELGNGTHTWWVQAWSPAGSAWSSAGTFTVQFTAPGAPVLGTPSGAIGDTYYPTYNWSKVTEVEGSEESAATWYYLWVNGPSGNVIKQWYSAADVCGISTCQVTPGTALGGGAHTWWVQAWNPSGATWSSAGNFTTAIPAIPGTPTLNAPLGTIQDRVPSFSWSEVTEGSAESMATWYYLWVNGPSGSPVIKQWYKALDVCSSGTCSVVSPLAWLSDGDYRWWVQAWNPAGGTWSATGNFTVAPSGGFDSQFNGSFTGWQVENGSWPIEGSAWLTTTGILNSFASVSNTTTYGNLDYQARLARTGCQTCSNSLWVRGTPDPLSSGHWYNGYLFNYTANGSYSVWAAVDGAYWALQPWTYTSAINQGSAWNTLRVVAQDSLLYYFINGVLVWSGSDSSLSSGLVGIGMYQAGYSNEKLWADWATLSSFESVVTDTISTEQQALNDAATDVTSPFYYHP